MNPSAPTSLPLATPIQKLPVSTGAPPSAPDDPSVTDVLNEMESVVSMAKNYQEHPLPNGGRGEGTGIHSALPNYPHSQSNMQYPSMAMAMEYGASTPTTSWMHLHTDNGKRAAVAMLLALMLFYPSGLFPGVYHRIARLSFLENYDLFVRIFLLGVFFYILLTYVPI